jgi:hypothetical protein
MDGIRLLVIIGLSAAGCGGGDDLQNGMLPDPAVGPPGGGEICPIDPDCFSVGTCEQMQLECQGVWRCEDVADLGLDPEVAGFEQRCWNGSGFPDGGDWECEQVDDTLTCRGSTYPDGGSSAGWSCEMETEFVRCDRDATYPDGGDGSEWSCYYAAEFIVCDGGGDVPDDGGDTPFDCTFTSEFGLRCGGGGDTPDGGDDVCWVADPGSASDEAIGVGTIVHGRLVAGALDGVPALYVRFAFTQAFVDNTYGANSSGGWGARGHTFRELVGSDHANVSMTNGDGDVVLDFQLDYISSDDTRVSSYGALGVAGGDGGMNVGDESAILHAVTSLDRNLNQRSCVYLTDSPSAAECADWDPQVVYEVFVREDAFGASGVGGPAIGEVHASPSKFESNTVPVVPGPCP